MACNCPMLCFLRNELCAIDPESSSCREAQEAVIKCECICPEGESFDGSETLGRFLRAIRAGDAQRFDAAAADFIRLERER